MQTKGPFSINNILPGPFVCIKPPPFMCAEMWGTGIRGLIRGMVTLPQGNQELLVVRDKVGRTPGELGVSK